jgi:hypothetical protein
MKLWVRLIEKDYFHYSGWIHSKFFSAFSKFTAHRREQKNNGNRKVFTHLSINIQLYCIERAEGRESNGRRWDQKKKQRRGEETDSHYLLPKYQGSRG